MYGFTALHQASVKGHIKVIQQLLENGLDLNITTHYGSTPLHLAAKSGSLEAVNCLLDSGSNPNIITRGFSVLQEAVLAGNIQIVARLFEVGSNLNIQSTSRRSTALQLGALTKNLELVAWLLDHSADPALADIQGFMPLHFASLKGDLPVLQRLLDEPTVDINSQSVDGLNHFTYNLRKVTPSSWNTFSPEAPMPISLASYARPSQWQHKTSTTPPSRNYSLTPIPIRLLREKQPRLGVSQQCDFQAL